MRRRWTGALAVSGTLLASLIILVPGAAAVVTSGFSNGVLTVTSDDQGDEIVVRCNAGGLVRINAARPDTGPVACTDITSIVVEGSGGADDIRSQQVNDVIFTGLVSVSIDGGEGNDVVRASEIADSITAGDGDDDVSASPADGDSIDGGAGRDALRTEIASDVAISDDAFTFGTDVIAVTSIEDLAVASSDAPETIDARTYTGTLDLTTATTWSSGETPGTASPRDRGTTRSPVEQVATSSPRARGTTRSRRAPAGTTSGQMRGTTSSSVVQIATSSGGAQGRTRSPDSGERQHRGRRWERSRHRWSRQRLLRPP